MKLHEILGETAVAGSIGAHSIAGARGSLFGGGLIDKSMLKRMVPPGGTILKLDLKKRKKVAGIPTIRYNNEA